MEDDLIATRFEIFDQLTPPDNWERSLAQAKSDPAQATGSRRLAWSAAAVVVVAALASAWAWMGDDSGQQVATSPDETSASTTTDTGRDASPPIISPLDPLGDTVMLEILVANPNGPGLAVLDLEDGELREYPPESNTLPQGAIAGASLTPDGHALVWSQGRVHFFADSDFTRQPVVVTPVDFVADPGVAGEPFVALGVDGETVWIVQPGRRPADGTVVDLIDIDTGDVRLHTSLPTKRAFPVDATPSGLILNAEELTEDASTGQTEPGSSHILSVDDTGTVTDMGNGEALAAKDNIAAISTGDGATLEIMDLGTTARRTVRPPRPGQWMPVGGPSIPGHFQPLPTLSEDGRLLVSIGEQFDVNGEPAESTLYSVSLTDASAEPLAEFAGPAPLATWSRDSSYVVLMTHDDVHLLDRADNELTPIASFPNETWPVSAR